MFNLIEGGDFSTESANVGLCYVSFLPKANDDIGIFRGPAIEEEGFLDVGIGCIENAAGQLGWRSPQFVGKLEKGYEELKKENKQLKRDLDKAHKALGLVKEIKKTTKN